MGPLPIRVLLSIVLAIPVVGPATQVAGEFLTFAQRLIRAAYPELVTDSRTVMSIALLPTIDRDWFPSGVTGHVFIRVGRREMVGVGPRSPNVGRSDETRVVPLIRADFSPLDGTLDTADFLGPYVRSARFTALEQRGKSHPEWDDAQISRELKKAGVSILPDQHEQFLAAFKPERFSGVLGTIRRARAEFVWRRLPYRDLVSPGWNVDLATADPERGEHCYGMRVEPFDLRLMYLIRKKCQS